MAEGGDNDFQPEESSQCCGILPYLNREDRSNLRNYKYVGGDTGFFYIHCWTPAANMTVKVCPKWLAPNMITLIGFCFMVGPFIWLFTAYGT